ncbi:MAG: hypothetical protein EXR73_05075, partial [Myxococcales bacterium]|nr:hypothetical protein [Myxococcales bacterium]
MMRNKLRAAGLCALVVGSLAPVHEARAQDPQVGTEPSFQIERVAPAPGPSSFFEVGEGDVAPHLGALFMLTTWAADRPLVVYHVADGTVLSEPVRLRVGAELHAAIGLRERYQVGFALPLVVYQDGDRLRELEIPGEDEALAATAFGDLRLHGRVRLVEPAHGTGAAVAIDLAALLPTGDDNNFAGDSGFGMHARALASFRTQRLAFALELGARVRSEAVQFLAPTLYVGSVAHGGLAASVRLPELAKDRDAELIGEVTGNWSDPVGDISGDTSGSSAARGGEWRIGARAKLVGTFTLGLAWGRGFGDRNAIGTPGWRALADLRFQATPRRDGDRDGVPDHLDRCRDQQEDVDGTEDADGCIDPDDDRDDVPDEFDRCQGVPEDRDGFQDRDGCPDLDDDADGVPDVSDKCPRESEDQDGVEDTDGCLDGDDDGDGLFDTDDRCPREAEDLDGKDDLDGCPDTDDDADGVPDLSDKCPAEIEDPDGWLDGDGCLDADDDRDGVVDGLDKCLDEPETVTSPKDTEDDGCPDGTPVARATPDGGLLFAARAEQALAWKRGAVVPTAAAKVVLRAVARAAHRAGWDLASGAALGVTAFNDAGGWSELAVRRSEQVVAVLAAEGVRAVAVPVEGKKGSGVRVSATKEGVAAGAGVQVKQRVAAPPVPATAPAAPATAP